MPRGSASGLGQGLTLRAAAHAAAIGLVSSMLLASEARASGRLLVRANFPAAMAALPGGGLVYGELRGGRVWRLDAHGRRVRRPLATVAVSTDGYNGLLGLAVDRHGAVFAAFTSPAPEERLVVARVWPQPMRTVWNGPASAVETTGGRVAFTRDDRLLVTVGDRLTSLTVTPCGIVWPAWPLFHGEILSLNPSAGPQQQPRLLSRGWFDPFALAISPAGQAWVADNAPPGGIEYLARADLGPKPANPTRLPDQAPAGLAAAGHDLFVCGYTSHTLTRYRINVRGRAVRVGRPLAHNCSIGVITLASGELAYANERQIRVLPLSGS